MVTTVSIAKNKVKFARENNCLKNTTPIINPMHIEVNKNFLNKLNGLHTLNKSKKLIKDVEITHKVEIFLLEIPMLPKTNEIRTTLITIEIPPGKALFIILCKKLPLILSLFGSSAKIKEGIPIVSTLVNVICIGSNGYCMCINKKSIASNVEYTVLTKNSDADL